MPRTQVASTPISRTGVAGVAPVAADVANGNFCTNDARTWLEVTNTDVSNPHNLSFQPTRTVDGQLVAPVSHAIAANTSTPIKFGPFSTADYSGQLQFNGDNAAIKVSVYTIGTIF